MPAALREVVAPSEEIARPYVSLVLPAFNEEENIGEAVSQAAPHLAAISPSWEILIVNDASTDGTGRRADALAAAHPGRVRVLHFDENRGLGTSMRTGFEHARGDVLIYCDSDLPFEMSALQQAHELMVSEQVALVAGYRDDRTDDRVHRKLYTWGYNRLVRRAFGLSVQDVNCPLKLFRREVLDAVPLQSDGVFIDAELLIRAHRGGFRMAQMPVRYRPRERGTSTLARPSVVLKTLHELALFRLGMLRNRPATIGAGA